MLRPIPKPDPRAGRALLEPPPRWKKDEGPPMTIAIGFTCSDALLISADTQLTVAGVTKLHGSKIFREEYSNGAKSAIAIAGDLAIARMTMQHIEQRIGDLAPNESHIRRIREQIETEVRDIYEKYIWPNPDRYNLLFQLIVMVWSQEEGRAKIFWTDRYTVSELRGYQTIGAGADLAHYVITVEGYAETMPESQVRPIAVKAVAKAKDWVDGCGGFTEIICMRNDGTLGPKECVQISAA